MRPSRRFIILAAVVAAALAASAALRRSASGPEPGRSRAVPRRIVSLAPSTTELLFALGLGERVVGVSEFCGHPPEARALPRMGGYYTPNFEVLATTPADLIVLLPEHGPVRERIRDLGREVLDVDHRSVKGILESVTSLGAVCGAQERAAALRGELEARIARVRAKVRRRPRPRVLVSVGRAMNEGGLMRITAAGRGGFYDDLLEMAGGLNPYEGSVPFPALSAEGVLALKPELVIEIMPDLAEKGTTEEDILRDWAAVPGLKNLPVRVVARPYAIVPGPRFVRLLEDFVAAIHPDAGHE